ncbi:MAG: pantoate--beta-alanine ligase [Gammaproteobacteria bacterium]|nr:pantoate--beta-alanine ligase [Gammaproteobacteria bacterium]
MISEQKAKNLRQHISRWRSAGQRIALVPTMGNLHEGHLKLVDRAHGLADKVVVSLFVNPLQFGEGEDLDSYPRTLAEDCNYLVERHTDLLFNPPISEVYSRPRSEETRVEVPGISSILCGKSRPGHFIGVTTVVCKLFNMVQPDVALFGEKDYQQLVVIRRMVEDLRIPVDIEGVATVRETDGLAMSSRNGYLTPDERSIAPALFRVLRQTAEQLTSVTETGPFPDLEQAALVAIRDAGLKPDYFQIRRASDLGVPGDDDRDLVILGAAFLGKARLIDNIQVRLT